MTRTMYDSVSAAKIPTTAVMVAGYVDGLYKWSVSDWNRFPRAVKVQIAVFATTNLGQVLDVERGNATPAQAPTWVVKRRALGVDPTVYCSESAWPAVRAAFRSQGIPEPHYWIASYPGIGPKIYAGSVAHQYADPGPYDLSVVDNYWPGVDPKPTPIQKLVIVVAAFFTHKPKSVLPGKTTEVVQLQRAVHAIVADGFWGKVTDRDILAVRAATKNTFPYGVGMLQAALGVKADGAFGPISKAALRVAVDRIQSALGGLTPDSAWGPKTEARWARERARLFKY
jgi:hypothetical protein